MDSIFNQYSYVVISVVVLAATILVLRYFLSNWRVISAAVTGLLILMIAGFLLLRPGFSDVENLSAAEAMIQNGRPTFMEFFSNYCAGCLAIRPVVDSIASDIGDTFNILRVDIHTETGRDLREHYNFSYTPEFLLLDTQGRAVWRSHSPPTQDQINLVKNQLTEMDNP
jgi:thiol-disulfide isomerase/thioredoxin